MAGGTAFYFVYCENDQGCAKEGPMDWDKAHALAKKLAVNDKAYILQPVGYYKMPDAPAVEWHQL